MDPFSEEITGIKVLSPLELEGRGKLRYFIRTLILFSLAFIVFLLSVRGVTALPTSLGRTALSALLLWWVYRGSEFAKWLAILLYGAGGCIGFYALLSSEELSFNFLLLSYSAFCMAFVYALLFSNAVNAFREFQRRQLSN